MDESRLKHEPQDAVSEDDGIANPDACAAAEHVPVLVTQVMQLLDPRPGQVVLDGTVGRGGHCGVILPRLAPGGRYIGLDVDPGNLQFVRDRYPQLPVALDLVHRNFAGAVGAVRELDLQGVDGVLADLGWASSQIADAQRGFSFNRDGPLDMRLDPTLTTTAADLVNDLDERELADLIWRWGEERLSRKIARKIVDVRARHPINTTRQLAELCAQAYGPARHQSRIDPATRTFQALRIAVNDELGSLENLLASIPELMNPGGRVVIISFHSLEDRLVKQAFRAYAAEGRAEVLTRKPLVADELERQSNPRSRSAKCRALRWGEGFNK